MNELVLVAQLQNLYGKQSFAIDRGDGAGWAQTFTPNGTYASPSYPEPCSGREALTEFANRFPTAAPNTRHIQTNIHLTEVTDAGAIANVTVLIVSGEPGQECRIVRTVTAVDEIEIADGKPLVARRQVQLEI